MGTDLLLTQQRPIANPKSIWIKKFYNNYFLSAIINKKQLLLFMAAIAFLYINWLGSIFIFNAHFFGNVLEHSLVVIFCAGSI